MPDRRSSARPIDSRPGITRVESAYRQILALIVEGSLAEGDRLPAEAEMAARFGISRPVVRQALARLQQAGIVDVRWGAGSYVRNAAGAATGDSSFGPVRSLEEVRATYELRVGLEGHAAALAAERRQPAALARLRRALEQMDREFGAEAMGRDADMEFHYAVAAASGNPFFERILRSLQQSIQFCMSLALTLSHTHPKGRLGVVQGEHVAILEAIESGDGPRAQEAMRLHLTNACRRLFQGPAEEDVA